MQCKDKIFLHKTSYILGFTQPHRGFLFSFNFLTSDIFSGSVVPNVSGRAKAKAPPRREEPPSINIGSCF